MPWLTFATMPLPASITSSRGCLWHARSRYGENWHDAQRQMLCNIYRGRCLAGDFLSSVDNVRGDTDNESSPKWTRTA
eukprot:1899759-Pyramimonas_sp.AAC.1